MSDSSRILITGATGQLGSYLLRELSIANSAVIAWSGNRAQTFAGVRAEPVDLAKRDRVAAAFRQARPTHVLHTAAIAAIAACYRDPDRAWLVNERGTSLLAELAQEADARLLLTSTDLVFDGARGSYDEKDSPTPCSIYGQTKAGAEPAVLATPRGAVVRVSLLFGPALTDRPTLLDQQAAAMREGRELNLFRDEWRTPLGLAAAARSLLTILHSDFAGLLHLGGPERLSRLDMGQRLAAHLRLDAARIVACGQRSVPAPEPRPRDTSLDSSQWRRLFPREPWPTFEESLQNMMAKGVTD